MAVAVTPHLYNYETQYFCTTIMEKCCSAPPLSDVCKYEFIYSSCPPSSRSSYMYRRCWFLRKQTDTACTAIVAFCADRPATSVVPYVKPGSDTIVGS
ncbi:hypothetical protein MtrunA17_Chr2g0306901 [Medicago truncatula]|uniref:Uncharacterized protein n=1 Tax=Medicago truncatula TaxID=3880 RepID=A0A072VII3_MEDTR|nr:hypothetical protein MTR_2g054660 [Medicago truncatula]RHN74141.1 hypothetical protein MtrunA17_Chr2g0306901 [Medicago truncatula]